MESSFKINSILLTGSSGFLGKSILSSLKLKQIVTLGRRNADINIDISQETFYIPPVDLVIHTAGKAHTRSNDSHEKKLFYDTNVNGTINLLNSIKESNSFPKSFLFISSVSVYGLDNGINLDETTSLNAKDCYGQSKIQAENLVTKWCNQYNVTCTILRLPLVVGNNPPGNLGSMINSIKTGFYFNIEGGKTKKSMVLATDIAKFILKAAEIGGIYNLTDGYHPSFSELSSHISIQLGKRKPINMPLWLARIIAKFGDLLGNSGPINTNRLKKITSDLTFDDSKAREAFGWNPIRVLDGFIINK